MTLTLWVAKLFDEYTYRTMKVSMMQWCTFASWIMYVFCVDTRAINIWIIIDPPVYSGLAAWQDLPPDQQDTFNSSDISGLQLHIEAGYFWIWL